MNIAQTRDYFLKGKVTKSEFIQAMYNEHHSKLFDYAEYLKYTNIASIEISDGRVVMTSRDKGIKMTCPAGDHRVPPVEALNFLDYEAAERVMMMKLIHPKACVLDIGANIGWYAIDIAKTYPSSRVHAFEPIPLTYSFLEENIQLNSLTNITPHSFGLSDQEQELTFYYYQQGSANASAANLSERQDAQLLTCPVQRLDDFVNANRLRVDFIKCDVEGAELQVFQGAVETLRRDKPVVFTEMLRKWAAKFDYHPNEMIDLFAALDYRCFVVEGEDLKEIKEITEDTIETNFFFLHKERGQ
jgi:FkbM family methyltransferase